MNNAERREYTMREMQALTRKLFEAYSVNYFDYARRYHDDSCFILATDMEYVDCFTRTREYIEAPPTIQPEGKHLWLEYIDTSFLSLASNEFNHANGMTVVKKHADCDEIYNFATSANNRRIYDLYLNRSHLLEQFVNDFFQAGQKLIQLHESDHKEMHEPCLPTEQITASNLIYLNGQSFRLTQAESICLAYLLTGHSAKMTAIKLGNSYRTVQKHIENVRTKCHVQRCAELVSNMQNKDAFIQLILPKD